MTCHLNLIVKSYVPSPIIYFVFSLHPPSPLFNLRWIQLMYPCLVGPCSMCLLLWRCKGLKINWEKWQKTILVNLVVCYLVKSVQICPSTSWSNMTCPNLSHAWLLKDWLAGLFINLNVRWFSSFRPNFFQALFFTAAAFFLLINLTANWSSLFRPNFL